MIYYHQLDPFLIQFTERFGIRWYSMAYIAGFLFAYFAGVYLIKSNRLQLHLKKLSDIVFFGALGAVFGGRIGFCLFYNPQLLFSFDLSFPYWSLLKVHEGGMSSHGGILGLLIASIFYAHRHKISLYSMADLGAVAGAFGIFLGRITNFINGELYGRVVEGNTWFAVKFPGELMLWASNPKLYQKKLLSLDSLFPYLNSSLIQIPSSYTWSQWISLAGEQGGDSVHANYVSYLCQLIYQSAYSAPINQLLEPLLSLRYPSQLYQSFFGGFMPFILISVFWIKRRRSGVISVVFILSYLFFRLFTEFYRQPDPSIGFQWLYLTRGQWLSLLMYLIAGSYAYFVFKKKVN